VHSIYPALFSRQTKDALSNFIAIHKKSQLILSEAFYPGMQTLATKLMRASSKNIEISPKYLSNYLQVSLKEQSTGALGFGYEISCSHEKIMCLRLHQLAMLT
jgi:hypothetical protein